MKTPEPRGPVSAFFAFLGVSVAAGLIATIAVTPAIALGSVATSTAISSFDDLPSYLEIPELAEKSNIWAVGSDGSQHLLASFYEQDREQVTWDQVADSVKDAAVAGEDPRFYEHGGIDVQGTARAVLYSYVLHRDVQGGSSITQQYVKNLLVQKAVLSAKNQKEQDAAVEEAIKQTPDRKLKEMRLAIALEKQYTKKEILLGYLNVAFFGGRVYGIQAASEYYYGIPAKDLDLGQAAALMSIVNNPEKFRFDRPDDEDNGAANGYAATKERQTYILGKMLDEGKIDKAAYKAAVDAPITPNIQQPSTGCVTAGDNAYFCDAVYWTIRNNPAFGATEDERVKLLQRGGLEIYTTLDLDLQAAAVSAINEYVPRSSDKLDVGATAVSVQVGTGRVLAMAQNKVYSNDPDVLNTSTDYSAVNYNTDFDYGGSSGLQPGSTYKVFTLGEWLNEGHSLMETMDAHRHADWGTFKDSCLGDQTYPGWNPKNDEGGNGGNWTALYNTINSENTGFIAMAKQLDLCGIRKMAQAFGVHRADGKDLVQGAGAVLGTNEIAPLTMANAFAGIAAMGNVCQPVLIDKVVQADGSEIAPPAADCKQAVDAKITAGMAYAMKRVLTQGSAGASNGRTSPRVPMIGKTGTTDGNAATWMSGASSKVATTVGVFNVTGKVDLRNTYFDGIQAAVIRHYLWPAIMSVANAKYGGDDFPDPDAAALKAIKTTVPDVRGKTPEQAKALIEAAGLVYQDGGPVDSELPAGVVVGTDPSGEVGKGSTITVFTSNGALVLLPDASGQDEATARATLKAFTVQVQTVAVTDPAQDGKVMSMSPTAGSPAKPGSTVTITVGSYTEPEPTPTATPTPPAGG